MDKYNTATKGVIAKKVAEKLEISKNLAYKAVSEVFDCIASCINSESYDRVEIRYFGVFSKKVTKKREGRNPQNGDPITIDPKRTIKFKASKILENKL